MNNVVFSRCKYESLVGLEKHSETLTIYNKVLTQKQVDKDKIYSIHKPFTACIAKGKAHKPYEFGNKVGIVTTAKSLVITGVKAFFGNPNDGKTVEPLLEQMQRNTFTLPQELIYDRGARGVKKVMNVNVLTPHKPLKTDSPYAKVVKRKNRRRAAIEPVFGHLKSQFRMQQNYLHGETAPQINALLAASAWNYKKLMNKLLEEVKKYLFDFLYSFFFKFQMVRVG